MTDKIPIKEKIKYGAETRADFCKYSKQCHDCGVEFGDYHKNGCDVEECYCCGRQKIDCKN